MIEVKDLTKIYKTKKGVVVRALDGVSLKLPDTGMVFILGKSGSGKSTLLNVIGGLDSIDSGEILINGTTTESFRASHFDSYRNTYVGFIFQEYNVLEELSVGANIALAIELQDRRATNEEINEILKEVELDGYGARKPGELSGGQKQRVAIARALVKRPEIIMADEPTGALDSATGKQVFETLKKLSHDKLVLIVSHDRELAMQYADRIIELKDGKIISDVEKSEAKEEDNACDSLVFGDGEITVKSGYFLTEEDRIAINKYLSSSSGVKLKVNKPDKKTVESDDFVATDESKIKSEKNREFKLIKSKLSLKNAFRLGSGALKYKKIRLVFTVLLSFFAFTLFGLADTVAAYDGIKTAANSIYDTKISYASFIKETKNIYGEGENDFYWESYGNYLSKADIEKISAETGIEIVGVYNRYTNLGFSSNIGDEKTDIMCDVIYTFNFSGLIAIDNDFINSHGFTLYGSLPTKDTNEIVINEYIFDLFTKTGYKTPGGETVKIESHTDLIGKTLNIAYEELKIVGILDTGFDYSRYLSLADPDAVKTMNPILYMALYEELNYAKDYSYASLCFVDESYITHVIEENSKKPDEYKGFMRLCFVSNVNNRDEYDYENMTAECYFDYLYSFSRVKDKIVFCGDKLESLEDNQIILPLKTVLDNLYAMGDISISEEIAKSLVTTVTYGLESYTTWDYKELMSVDAGSARGLYSEAIAKKYAAENLSDAIRYFGINNGSSTEPSLRDIVDNYAAYLVSGVDDPAFTPSSDIDFSFYFTNEFAKLVPKNVDGFFAWEFYTLNETGSFWDYEIVGVLPLDRNGEYENTVVVSDSLAGKALGTNDGGIYSFALGDMPEARNDILKIVEFSTKDFGGNSKYGLLNSVTVELSFVDELLDILGKVFLYIGIAVAIFASVMLSNFIAISISYKKQEIGILRAIGARSGDVFRIFFAESFIIAMINYVLSVIGTAAVTGLINNLLRDGAGLVITFLSFGIRQTFLLLLISLAIAFIATFLPVKKIASMKPIDAIKNIK